MIVFRDFSKYHTDKLLAKCNGMKEKVFIVNDSLFNRTSCKKTELESRVLFILIYFSKKFCILILSWSDENTLIPLSICLIASSKDTNIIEPVKNFDNRTLTGK